MGNRFERFLDSHFALKSYIFICIISILATLPLSFLSSYVITIVIASLCFLSGILLNKRDVSFFSLISILVFVYIIGVLNLLIFNTSNGVLSLISNILYLVFFDPLQIKGLLPQNYFLDVIFFIIIPIFPVAFMYIGIKVFGSSKLSARLDNLKINGRFFKKVICITLPILIIVNIYFLYNPRLSVQYYNGVPFEGNFEEKITIDEKGNYKYLETSYDSDEVKKKIDLKLTKKELLKLEFNIVYMNMFFNLGTDLSVNNKTDQGSQSLEIKWFGKTKEVGGYGVENSRFERITSILREKIDEYYKHNYKYGYIDKNDSFSLYPKYDYANGFWGEYAFVEVDGKRLYINKYGNVIPESEVNYARKTSSDLVAEIQNNKYGFINNEGKFIITPKYHAAQDFSEGLAAVWDENYNWGYINEKEEKIITIDFKKTGNSNMRIEDLSGFHEGLAWTKWNNKYGYIDKKGAVVIQPLFDITTDFSEGLACVYKNGKWGYIDKTGKYIIEPVFDMAFPFSEGLGCVRIGDEDNGKWGYIDKTGKYIIDTKYSQAGPFVNGLACVMVDFTKGDIGEDNKYKLK